MSQPHVLGLADCGDVALVGGKAINLAKLINAGFPVPGGFVVTTAGFRAAREAGGMPPRLAEEILSLYRQMGSPPVAVRSSATAEDMAGASMAGQYETYLDIRTEAALLEAVGKCWAAVDSARTRSYLAEHGIEVSQVEMAVVVQQLVAADVAGVLFTTNPRTGAAEMIIEASWGLGEAVVSGLVQPDVLRVDRATGSVIELRVADKQVCIPPGRHGEAPVPLERRTIACLQWPDVLELWKLGLKAAEHFGSAQDLEWAIAGGKVYLLQSRNITTLEDAEAYAELLQRTRRYLRAMAEAGRIGWAVHNLGETLPHPTPMTWSIISRFMSGAGGFGEMYRMAGFAPSDKARSEGFLTLLAGKVYMDLSMAPEMFFEDFPFRYDLELLRNDPNASQNPPTIAVGTMGQRMRSGKQAAAANARLHELSADYDRKLADEHVPQFIQWQRQQKRINLATLSNAQWLELWNERHAKVLDEFAPRSLLPSLLAGMALEELKEFCREHFWDEDPDELVGLLAVTSQGDLTVQSNIAMYQLAKGSITAQAWLEQFGHRAPNEFDLAAPRWHEQPQELTRLAARLADGADPAGIHHARCEQAQAKLRELSAGLGGRELREFNRRLELVRRYIGYREDGKHYLMLGYELLRDMIIDAGRRLGIAADDVFLLTIEELRDALRTLFAPLHLLDRRRTERRAESRIMLPRAIGPGDIDSLGEAPPVAGGDRHAAFPLSTGSASGPARIVHSPSEAGDLGKGYVLVCRSTDPAWTPLFVNAAALVLECGGTLSHGAVVSREMGIPAVVLPGATQLFADGEVIAVDGHGGSVARGSAAPAGPAAADPNDTRIPARLLPPPAGAKERRINRVRNWFLIGWGIYLLAAGLSWSDLLIKRQWLYTPSIEALDKVLWPLVPTVGKPMTVVLLAGVLGALMMIGQRLLTDNRRIVTAKLRAAALMKEARALPEKSPRRLALARAAGVQGRIMGATFVPLALVLGPMCMSFMWLTDRLDPASWNTEPGRKAFIKATVDSEFRGELLLSVPAPLMLDGNSRTRTLTPPVRETLESLAEYWWDTPTDLSNLPWELQAAAMAAREHMVGDLNSYLKQGVPDEKLSWTIRSPVDANGHYTVELAAIAPAKATSQPASAPASGGSAGKLASVVCDWQARQACLPKGKAASQPATSPSTDGCTVSRARAVLVYGNAAPPVACPIGGDDSGPIKSLELAWDVPPERKFWTPFASLGWQWDTGWLLIYLAVYVPAMFLVRWVLGVA